VFLPCKYFNQDGVVERCRVRAHHRSMLPFFEINDSRGIRHIVHSVDVFITYPLPAEIRYALKQADNSY